MSDMVRALEATMAVVTGASSGSGLGIARRFGQEGVTVVMLARGGGRLKEMAPTVGAGAVPLPTDVDVPKSVHTFDRIGDRFGKIDILIKNAAVYRPCRVALRSAVDIGQQIATNFAGRCIPAGSPFPCYGLPAGRHVEHLQRVAAAPRRHALDVCGHESRPQSLCARPGATSRRRHIRGTTGSRSATSMFSSSPGSGPRRWTRCIASASEHRPSGTPESNEEDTWLAG
jgi:NAD(P)-dependent dehydrogenase (short-subunit alcohol dehydrogenase family)